MARHILHVDMDAFFASVEQRDNPALTGLPVIVGGLSGRGVVSTASYEARRFGVHSAMPMATARRLCPDGIFIPPDHKRYSRVSREIMAIFQRFSPAVEPLSLDEAFLDLSGMHLVAADLVAWTKKLKAAIKQETGLIASAGLAPNKFLAKLASDLDKPDGLVVITQEEAKSFLASLPVGRLPGIGKNTQAVLSSYGITTIGSLKAADRNVIAKVFGNQTDTILDLARGIDNRPVIPEHAAKSIGKENTFEKDITTLAAAQKELLRLAEETGWRLRRHGLIGQTVTLKVRYGSFKTITRSHSSEYGYYHDEDIYNTVLDMAAPIRWNDGVRLLGVSVSRLSPHAGYGGLNFGNEEKKEKRTQTIDQIKERFGENIIGRGLREKE